MTVTNWQNFLGLMNENVSSAVILDNYFPYDSVGEVRKNVGFSFVRHFLRRESGVKVELHTSFEKFSLIEEYVKQGLIYIRKPCTLYDIKSFFCSK